MKKTILITGASSGIGKATAQYFHNEGWNVVATMRHPENETELHSLDGVLVSKLDVLNLESIEHAISEGINTFGSIDVLLNNAGYGAYGPLEAFPRENMIRQFNTNVIGLLDVSRAILPHFRKHKTGKIINISSIGGKMTFPLGALYHGTKHAVEGISEALSFEVEAFGGQVKIVEPGMISTDFATRSFDFQNNTELTEYQDLIGKVMNGFAEFGSAASPASTVAKVIFQAANDHSTTMRYRAGEDAHQILDARKSTNEDAFIQNMKSQFKL